MYYPLPPPPSPLSAHLNSPSIWQLNRGGGEEGVVACKYLPVCAGNIKAAYLVGFPEIFAIL